MVAVHRQNLGEPGRARVQSVPESLCEGRLAGPGRPCDRDDGAGSARPSKQGGHQVFGMCEPGLHVSSQVAVEESWCRAACCPSALAPSPFPPRQPATRIHRTVGPAGGARAARQAAEQRRRYRTASRDPCAILSTPVHMTCRQPDWMVESILQNPTYLVALRSSANALSDRANCRRDRSHKSTRSIY